jgi:hypothetical protein
MRELYFEEFISFTALLLYMSIWNSQPVLFTILIRSIDREKKNFCKIKCYANTFDKRKSLKVTAYRYSTIIYWTKFPRVSHLKKKRFSPFERHFPYLLLWNFSNGTGWKIFRGAWNAWHKNSGYRVSVSTLYRERRDLFFVAEITSSQKLLFNVIFIRDRNLKKANLRIELLSLYVGTFLSIVRVHAPRAQ